MRGRTSAALVRLPFLLLAVAALAWVGFVAPGVLFEQRLIRASERIVAGETYSSDAMEALAAQLDKERDYKRSPSVLAPISIVRLRLVEGAIARNETASINANLISLRQALNEAVASSPYNSFQWLLLFWLVRTQHAFDPRDLQYLWMSYELGPLEGWVALKRSPMALAIHPLLPTKFKEAAFEEIINLVRSHYYAQVANILSTSSPIVRKEIAPRLIALSLTDRQILYRHLVGEAVTDLPVPGIDAVPSRPWR